MRKITRKEWIEALKSGEYEQGGGRLYNEDKFCCLGVACSLAGVPTTEMLTNNNTVSFDDFVPGLNEKLNLTPDGWNGTTNAHVLSELNDEGTTFEQIADLLIFDTWARGLEQEQ